MVTLTELSIALLAGSLTTLNPCVFPLLPLVLGSAVQANRWAPVAMGAGMVLMFALLGLLVGVAGDALGFNSDTIRLLGAWLLIGFGCVMCVPFLNARFTEMMTPLASGSGQQLSKLNGKGLGSAFATGGLLGMVWSPCSGPILASALTIVATEGGAIRGTAVLGMFGLGAASVLVAAAYASQQGFGKVRQWVLTHMERIKKGFGLVLIVVGVAILTGADKWLEAQVVSILPDAWLGLTTRF